jgi:hypothetical protein
VFENGVLRKIFVLMRGKVTEELRRLRNELHDLSSSPNIWALKSRRMEWVGHVAYTCSLRGVYRVLVGQLEGKRPLGGQTSGRMMLK